jgi:iron complex transport system substrate-binding protein
MTTAPLLGAALMAAIGITAAASPAAAQATFTDHRGREITLEAPPQRLVVITRAAPIVYYAVDRTTEHLAGINPTSLNTFRDGFYATLIPELMRLNATAAREGFAPNVEAILQTNPDLVVQWTHTSALIEPLERVGLRVVGWACCTEAQRRDYLTISGAIAGQPERARRILAMQDEAAERLRARFARLPEGNVVRLLEVDQLRDQIRVVANASRDHALAGTRNLAADGTREWWRTIDAEQFLAWNPDLIIIPPWGGTDLTPAAFRNHPVLRNVSAVRSGRVYRMPKFTGTPDAPEVHLVLTWIAIVAHRDAALDGAPFRERIKATYRDIYGREPTDAQVDQILELEINGASAQYRELFGG